MVEIIINFKNYLAGKEVLKLAKKIEMHLPKSIVSLPATEINEIKKQTALRIFSQHFDFHDKGKNTGFVIAENIKHAGASGTILNHSEHRLKIDLLKKTMKKARENSLEVCLCVENISEAKKFIRLNPKYLALEDKKLIGSGKSITEYNSKDVEKFALLLKGTKIIPLCGAGINSIYDVEKAIKLGCKGILISSAIANSQNPEKLLLQLNKLS